jgi:tetratricopeptide (TPR) repeat protein
MNSSRKWIILFAIALCAVGCSRVASGYSLSEAQNYQRRQDWNGLLRYTQSWTQAQPKNSDAWAMMSVAYFFGMNRPDLALEPTKRAVALSPRDPGGWTALGNIYMKLKRYREAANAFQHSVDLSPNNGNHWNNLATAYSYEGDYRRALLALEKQEVVAGPHMNYSLWYNLGNGYLNVYYSGQNGAATGRDGTAILFRAHHAYQQTIQMNSRYANAWNNLGIIEQMQGAAKNALYDYQRASQLGDSLARSNYTSLKNAMAAAEARREQAARCSRPTVYVPGCPYISPMEAAHDAAVFNWNHTYHPPGDIQGRPW